MSKTVKNDEATAKQKKDFLASVAKIVNKKMKGAVFLVTLGSNKNFTTISHNFSHGDAHGFIDSLMKVLHPEMAQIEKMLGGLAKEIMGAGKKKKARSTSPKKKK